MKVDLRLSAGIFQEKDRLSKTAGIQMAHRYKGGQQQWNIS